jgi:hypothetical protein
MNNVISSIDLTRDLSARNYCLRKKLAILALGNWHVFCGIHLAWIEISTSRHVE